MCVCVRAFCKNILWKCWWSATIQPKKKEEMYEAQTFHFTIGAYFIRIELRRGHFCDVCWMCCFSRFVDLSLPLSRVCVCVFVFILLCLCHSIVRLCVNFVCLMLLRNAVMCSIGGKLHLIWFCSVRLLIRFGLLFSFFVALLFMLYTYEGSGLFRQFIVISEACDQRTNICVKNLDKIRFHIFLVSSQHAFNSYIFAILILYGCSLSGQNGIWYAMSHYSTLSNLLLSFVYAVREQTNNKITEWTKRKIDWFGKHTCRIPCVYNMGICRQC